MIRQKHRSTLPRCFSGFARRNIPDSLLYDLTHDLARTGSGIGLIGVDMHGRTEIRMDAADNVAKDQRTAVGVNLDRNGLFILDAPALCGLRVKMDVAFRERKSVV